MGKRDDLIAKYAADLSQKCGVVPDMKLLEKVTIGCGPAIYNEDTAVIAVSDPGELLIVKNNFLIRKLGLADSAELMDAIESVLETYGSTEPVKYRAVVYYMLTRYFAKEAIYGLG
jgi:uncharacterized protein DUF2853